MKRVSLFLAVVVFAALFAGCSKEEDEKGIIEITNNSSVMADGGIAEYDNTDNMEVFVNLAPGTSQKFELKAGIRYVIVAWDSDDSDHDLIVSPQMPTVIADQTQTVSLTDPE